MDTLQNVEPTIFIALNFKGNVADRKTYPFLDELCDRFLNCSILYFIVSNIFATFSSIFPKTNNIFVIFI